APEGRNNTPAGRVSVGGRRRLVGRISNPSYGKLRPYPPARCHRLARRPLYNKWQRTAPWIVYRFLPGSGRVPPTSPSPSAPTAAATVTSPSLSARMG